jgi:hypothetical protein
MGGPDPTGSALHMEPINKSPWSDLLSLCGAQKYNISQKISIISDLQRRRSFESSIYSSGPETYLLEVKKSAISPAQIHTV